MNIIVETVPHSSQRYSTCGDWQFTGPNDVLVSVSDMKNWKYELLVAFHEIIEVYLCRDRKISQKEVDEFDKDFEERRMDDSEPGNSEYAPYHKEHVFATKLEKMFAKELKVDWKKYDKTVNEL